MHFAVVALQIRHTIEDLIAFDTGIKHVIGERQATVTESQMQFDTAVRRAAEFTGFNLTPVIADDAVGSEVVDDVGQVIFDEGHRYQTYPTAVETFVNRRRMRRRTDAASLREDVMELLGTHEIELYPIGIDAGQFEPEKPLVVFTRPIQFEV